MAAKVFCIWLVERSDTRLRWAYHDLPEKVESGGVSQVVEEQRLLGEVAEHQEGEDSGQPRFLFDLCVLQVGAAKAGHEDEPLCDTFEHIPQSAPGIL